MRGDLALILAGGLLGSSHCIGMCGGFALSLGLGAPTLLGNFGRQLLYSAGRIFTYGVLGCAAGFAGLWFARRSSPLVHAQSLLSFAAGVFLIVQGMHTLVRFPRFSWFKHATAGTILPCQSGSFLGPLLTSPRASSMLIAGVLNGLLPCGLVYGYLALASSGASLAGGLATMVAFGLGTVPLMVLSGVGASALSRVARRRLFRVAGLCVLATGLIAVGRGVAFWGCADTTQCPGCRTGAPSFFSLDAILH
jgi:uncharacterized protein